MIYGGLRSDEPYSRLRVLRDHISGGEFDAYYFLFLCFKWIWDSREGFDPPGNSLN